MPVEHHGDLLDPVLGRTRHHGEQVEPPAEAGSVEARVAVEEQAQQDAQPIDLLEGVVPVRQTLDLARVVDLADEAALAHDRVVVLNGKLRTPPATTSLSMA